MTWPLRRRLRFHLPMAGMTWTVSVATLTPFVESSQAAWSALAFVLAHAVSYELFRADRLATDPPGFQDALTLSLAAIGGSLLAATAAIALRQFQIGSALTSEAAVHLALLLGWLVWRRLRSVSASPDTAKRALFLVGPDSRAMVAALSMTSAGGVAPVGWLDERREQLGASVDGLPVLGAVEELPYLVDWHSIDAVVALTRAHEADLVERLREQTQVAGVELILLPVFDAMLRNASAQRGPQPVSSAA